MNSKRSFVPIAAMFTAIVLVTGVGPRLAAVATGKPLKNTAQVAATEGVCLQYARVGELLDKGNLRAAKSLLDEIGGQPLVVESWTGGQGALEQFSPVTLLVKVARRMAEQARTEAREGNGTEALTWVARCRKMAVQVLMTPEPNLEALHTARSLDSIAGRADVEVHHILGDTLGEKTVQAREREITRFHQTIIHPRVQELPESREQITTTKMQELMQMYLTQRLRLMAYQGQDAG